MGTAALAKKEHPSWHVSGPRPADPRRPVQVNIKQAERDKYIKSLVAAREALQAAQSRGATASSHACHESIQRLESGVQQADAALGTLSDSIRIAETTATEAEGHVVALKERVEAIQMRAAQHTASAAATMAKSFAHQRSMKQGRVDDLRTHAGELQERSRSLRARAARQQSLAASSAVHSGPASVQPSVKSRLGSHRRMRSQLGAQQSLGAEESVGAAGEVLGIDYESEQELEVSTQEGVVPGGATSLAGSQKSRLGGQSSRRSQLGAYSSRKSQPGAQQSGEDELSDDDPSVAGEDRNDSGESAEELEAQAAEAEQECNRQLAQAALLEAEAAQAAAAGQRHTLAGEHATLGAHMHAVKSQKHAGTRLESVMQLETSQARSMLTLAASKRSEAVELRQLAEELQLPVTGGPERTASVRPVHPLRHKPVLQICCL